jgi:hypothetical protein
LDGNNKEWKKRVRRKWNLSHNITTTIGMGEEKYVKINTYLYKNWLENFYVEQKKYRQVGWSLGSGLGSIDSYFDII